MPPHSGLQLMQTGVAALLPLLMMSGCATPESVSEQTAPLRTRIAQLERSLQSVSDLARAAREQAGTAQDRANALQVREALLAGQVESLQNEIRAVRQQLADQAVGRASGEERSVEGTARTRGALGQASALAEESEPTREQLARIEALLPQQAERLTQVELRLDELATQGREATDRIAGLGSELTAVQTKLNDDATSLRALDGRLSQLDARLGGLAADWNERLSETNQRLDEVSALAREARTLAGQGERRIIGNVLFTVTLTEDSTMFPLSAPELGSQDSAKLDGLVARLRTLGKNYHLEIQGHTDNSGYDDYNYELGRARAEVVKRYLSEKGRIPPNRMSVVSFGSSSPLGDKATGNRRITIVVLE